MTRTRDPIGLHVSPATRDRFVGIVEANPGCTADELEPRLERTHDRLILRAVLKNLVDRCCVQRDPAGRYWPV